MRGGAGEGTERARREHSGEDLAAGDCGVRALSWLASIGQGGKQGNGPRTADRPGWVRGARRSVAECGILCWSGASPHFSNDVCESLLILPDPTAPAPHPGVVQRGAWVIPALYDS